MEFKDERIDSALARIYRNGIALLPIIALTYLVIKWFVIQPTEVFDYLYMSMEFLIALCSIIIYIVGEIRFVGKSDERIEHEKTQHHLKSAKIFFVLSIYIQVACSFFYRTSPYESSTDANVFMNTVLTVSFIYIYYNFKKNDIELNYSFIYLSKKDYYKKVFSKIGKLFGICIIPYCLLAVFDAYATEEALNFFVSLWYGLKFLIPICVVYFILSVIEKLQYDDERPILFKRGTVMVCVLFGVIILLSWTLSILSELNMTNPDRDYIDSENLLTLLGIRRYISTFIRPIIMAQLLCTFAAHFADRRLFNLLKAWAILYIVNIIFNNLISDNLAWLIIDNDNMDTYYLMVDILKYYSLVVSCITYVLRIFMVIILIKKFDISKWIITEPTVYVISVLYGQFLSSHIDEWCTFGVSVLTTLITYAVYLYCIKKYDKQNMLNDKECV